MNRIVTRRGLLLIVLAVIAGMVLLFYNEGLFAYQRWRLNGMGCNTASRVDSAAVIGEMQPCQKLWAHRVNSTKRFNRLESYFAGLETDVVFDTISGKFNIYHPPGKPSGLVLDTYLEKINRSGKKLWIDVKILPSTRITDIVNAFAELGRVYPVADKIIIESSNIELVNKLALAGFTVSYLVPRRYLKEENRLTASALATQLAPGVKFVSQEDIFVETLKKKFPGKKIITWAVSFSNYNNPSHFMELINDSMISVVLVNVKSNGYL